MSASLSTAALAPKVMAPGADKLVAIDLRGIFPLGGLTGTPTVACVRVIQAYTDDGEHENPGDVATDDLSFATPQVNDDEFDDDDGDEVSIGFAVQVRIDATNGVDGGDYWLKVTASDGDDTDSLYCCLQIRESIPVN